MNHTQLRLEPLMSRQLAELYAAMEGAYDQVAGAADFSCAHCPDNCCDSYFQHHTYIEWAYLWEGLQGLAAGKLDLIMQRARDYVIESEKLLARGARPDLMCPLNEEGRCALYSHRLMICRLHGVAATLTGAAGRRLHFPGCFRYQEQSGRARQPAPLERTAFYRQLAELELKLLGLRRAALPKVKKTIAELLVQGPPRLS